MNSETRIAVVGAGLVGLSCALWLQKKGLAVTLIDQADPGSGTSSGNACTIADYGCIPVNSPAIFKRLPSLLLSKESPLSVNPGYALSHPSWMLKFLLNCRQPRVDRTTRLLGRLLAKTWDGLDPLLDMAAARDLVRQNGCMYVYRSERDYQDALPSNLKRREQGAHYVELGAADIRDLEPNLRIPFERGLLFEQSCHVLNPRTLCERYFVCFQRQQGNFVRQRAVTVRHGLDAVQVELDNGEKVDARRVVIAAGAFSRQIDGIPMQLLPLDTERGYHVQFNGQQHLLQRPVCWNTAGFYATPMNEGLRAAGTVEIAGLGTQKNQSNLDYLTRKVRQMLDLPPTPDQEWLGFRPTLPDALPVIGFSTVSEYILYAFGHQHIGLTLAGITGKLVAELANREQPSLEIKPFSPARFL